jgi:hypothetical protein
MHVRFLEYTLDGGSHGDAIGLRGPEDVQRIWPVYDMPLDVLEAMTADEVKMVETYSSEIWGWEQKRMNYTTSREADIRDEEIGPDQDVQEGLEDFANGFE